MAKALVFSYPFYLLFSFILVLFSCKNRTDTARDHLVFRYNEFGITTSLDPAFARNPQNIWPVNQIFNGLVQLDDSLNVRPDVAKSWTVSEDALQYTFSLRDDIYFHKSEAFQNTDSTRRVVASDFTYSFDRLVDPDVASPGGWVLQNVASYLAPNDSTFVIQLKQPFPAFLGLLSMRYCSVVPREAIEFYGSDFRSHPVGTGPFQFKYWEENVKLILRKNHQYYEKDQNGKQLPYLEAVAITFLPDKQSEFLQFVQGKLDFLNSLDASYKDELLTIEGQLQPQYHDKIDMATGPYLNTEYLGLFLDSPSPELQSENLRKAINYGFDRKMMIKYLKNGIGIPAEHGFIPKGLPGFAEIDGYHYNPYKAKELLDAYKKESGKSQVQLRITTNSNYLDICEFIQRELEKIGFDVAVDVLPVPTLRKDKTAGKLDIFRASWIADYPDAENYLSLFYSKNFSPGGPNYMHFSDPLFDRWYEKSLTITNDSIRQRLYTRMDSLLISKAPIVPLYYDQVTRFTQKNVHGLTNNPQNTLILKRVWKDRK